MLDIMYEIPSKGNVKECIINDKVISGEEKPEIVIRSEKEVAKKQASDSAESA